MRALTLLAMLMPAAPAWAHHTEGPADASPGWTWDPWITVPLAAAGVMYAIGYARWHSRSATGRAVGVPRAWQFAGAWLALAGALVSPLHAAGERSFAAHMTEHELLMLVAAPLLVLARPWPVMLWAWPTGARRVLGRAGRGLRPLWSWAVAPIPATLLQAAALWLWHMPALFDRALASDGWHLAQHASFLLSALLFWHAMLHGRGAAGRALAALCLFATSIVSGALGALMAFATSPWYAGYAALGTAPFGLSPAEDQQLAGLLMWVPGGLVHAGAALVMVRGLLTQTEARHAL